MTPSPDQAIIAADKILKEKYPGAQYGFATGSIVRGAGSPGSDLDLVVIFDTLGAAWREAFNFSDFPVEAFVHDPGTLDWFIAEDRRKGYPTLAHMIATGHILGDDRDAARKAQKRCKALMDAGPAPSPARIDELRYIVTDLLEDVRVARPLSEIRAIAIQLHQPLGDLALMGRGQWSGKGKWLVRRLAATDAALAEHFDAAFLAAITGDTTLLLALVGNELNRVGGPRFDGDKRTAPPAARS